MGTSSRRTAPDRMKDKMKKIEYTPDNDMKMSDFKDLLGTLFYPNGRESISSKSIIKSCTSTNFIKTLKKLIHTSENYGNHGTSAFGINFFDNFSFSEQVDLLSDFLVEDEDPVLKQSIKDILLANGIDKTFSNLNETIKCMIKTLLERHTSGILLDSFYESNEAFSSENYYKKIDIIFDNVADIIMSQSSLEKLVVNINDGQFVGNWLQETVRMFLKGVAR